MPRKKKKPMSRSEVKTALQKGENIRIVGPQKSPGRPVRLTKKVVKDALARNGGFISYAAKATNSTPEGFRKAMDRYGGLEDFRQQIIDSHLDMAEHSLLKQVRSQNTKATIYLLDCLGAERGYGNKTQRHLHAHAHAKAGSGTWMDIMKRQIESGKIDRHTGEVVDAEFVENGKSKG